jgi:hypothetical protein
MTNQQMSHTEELLSFIFGKVQEGDILYQRLADLIPDIFIAQCGYSHFFVKPQFEIDGEQCGLVSQSRYGGKAQTDYIRIRVSNPKLILNSKGELIDLQFQLDFQGNMDYRTGQIQLFGAPPATPDPSIKWIKGFKSNNVVVSYGNDLFSEKEWEDLIDFAEEVEEYVESYGDAKKAPYNAKHVRYLVANNPDALFRFQLDIRTNTKALETFQADSSNPDIYPLVPGILAPEWAGFDLVKEAGGGLRTRVGEQPVALQSAPSGSVRKVAEGYQRYVEKLPATQVEDSINQEVSIQRPQRRMQALTVSKVNN